MAAGSKASSTAADREVVLTRVFDAPRELVFESWTNPKHMARWWGPKNFTNPVCELDPRPGGAFQIVMRAPDGAEFPFKGVYREVKPPARIVYTGNMSDVSDEWHDAFNPNRDRSKGRPKLESITTVTFEDVGGQTQLTVHMLFETQEIRDGMLKMQMAEGFDQSFDKLEGLLAKG